MDSIQTFLSKWGIIILIVFSLLTFFNTCGVKGKVDRLDKKVVSLETKIHYNDSINTEISSVEQEIANLEVAREVVYTTNAIVRTAIRPDDVMNTYSQKIKILQEKLNKIKNARNSK